MSGMNRSAHAVCENCQFLAFFDSYYCNHPQTTHDDFIDDVHAETCPLFRLRKGPFKPDDSWIEQEKYQK